ncbi:rRNA biogenesis protein rrp36, variant 3 [Bonamia ostreae]|uniref:rRNA biogenesis protein RRP36 n=1 Tax=Bonamia ostreae TaxID=126728 RepID=A0ABV2AMJ6_9EUKA
MSNEDRPREISFKKPPKKTIPRVRIKRKIDPRFKKQYGSFNETHFRDNYKFLDELEEEEIENIKSDMRHSKSREEKSRLGKKLIKLNSKLQTRKYNDALREKKSDLLKRERSLTKKGKKMFFPKQCF